MLPKVEFWAILHWNYKIKNSQGNSNVDFGADNQPISALKVSKEAYWARLKILKENNFVGYYMSNSVLRITFDSFYWHALYLKSTSGFFKAKIGKK